MRTHKNRCCLLLLLFFYFIRRPNVCDSHWFRAFATATLCIFNDVGNFWRFFLSSLLCWILTLICMIRFSPFSHTQPLCVGRAEMGERRRKSERDGPLIYCIVLIFVFFCFFVKFFFLSFASFTCVIWGYVFDMNKYQASNLGDGDNRNNNNIHTHAHDHSRAKRDLNMKWKEKKEKKINAKLFLFIDSSSRTRMKVWVCLAEVCRP